MAVRVVGTHLTGALECGWNGDVIIALDEVSRKRLGGTPFAQVPAAKVEYVDGSEDPEMETAEKATIQAARERGLTGGP